MASSLFLRSSLLSSRNLFSSSRGLATKVLVVGEQKEGVLSPYTLNAITAANLVPSSEVTALLFGSSSSDAAQGLAKAEGVSKVICAKDSGFDNLVAESVSKYVSQLQEKESFSHIIASASSFSKTVLPHLAAKLDVSPISEISDVKSENTFVRPIYAGNALATIESKDSTKVVTIRATSFDAAEVGSGNGEIVEDETPAPEVATKFVSREVKKSERPDLGSASIVISGGRAMKSSENFEMLYELADLVGGAVGASRAAVDAGMVSNELQVGQTGKIVAPQLYVAVGISGAIQHLAGMKDSKNIVCVNKDPEAPIFQVSDYGLVADLFKAVPELTEKIKADK